MKNIYKKVIIGSLALGPIISFAEGKTLSDIAQLVVGYLNVALALIMALAFVTFVWNVYLYFFTEKDKKEAGKYVMFSVIGFFVILSFWGIVAVVMNSLNLNNQAPGNFNFIYTGKVSGTRNPPSVTTPIDPSGANTTSPISPDGANITQPIRGQNNFNPNQATDEWERSSNPNP